MIIALTGIKHCGKSTIGGIIASETGGSFCDVDSLIEDESGKTAAALYRENGAEAFKQSERAACARIAQKLAAEPPQGWFIIAAGGGIADNPEALSELKRIAVAVFIDIPFDAAWRRIENGALANGRYPAFLDPADPKEDFRKLYKRRTAIYRGAADMRIPFPADSDGDISRRIALKIIKETSRADKIFR